MRRGAATPALVEQDDAIPVWIVTAPHRVARCFRLDKGGGHAIETRGVVARFDPDDDMLTVWINTQMPHRAKAVMVAALGLSEHQVRVIVPDTGGGFGPKAVFHPEELALPAASVLLKRPIKWIEDRRENFAADVNERDQDWDMECAADAEGRLLAIRGRLCHDHGACTPYGVALPYNAGTNLIGAYVLPAFRLEINMTLTNMVPVAPTRGAGRPQGTYVMERFLDRIADKLGLTRDEVRRRNMIKRDALPYRTASGLTYDSGDFLGNLDKALVLSDWDGFEARRKDAQRRGKLAGLGLANRHPAVDVLELADGHPGALLHFREARLRFFTELNDRLFAAGGALAAMDAATTLLGTELGVSRCAYADVDPDGDRFWIRHDYTAPGQQSSAGEYSLDEFGARGLQPLGALAPQFLDLGRHAVDAVFLRDADAQALDGAADGGLVVRHRQARRVVDVTTERKAHLAREAAAGRIRPQMLDELDGERRRERRVVDHRMRVDVVELRPLEVAHEQPRPAHLERALGLAQHFPVLVVDDAHLLDKSSLSLLTALAAAPDATWLVILGGRESGSWIDSGDGPRIDLDKQSEIARGCTDELEAACQKIYSQFDGLQKKFPLLEQIFE